LGEAGHLAVARRVAAINDGVPILLSASRDGRFLAFQRERQQADVYTAEFDASKERIGTPRRLTMDERDDMPTAWTPDGTAVLFFSSRNGRSHIFKQRVGERTAELLVGGPTDNMDPRVASDGKWVFFQQTDPERQGASRIMRMPIEGGQPERVHTYPELALPRCPARGPCMVFEYHRHEIAVRVLDPPRVSRELLRFPASPFGEDPLPSGEGIAFIVRDAEPRNRIRTVPFDGSTPSEITVADASSLVNLDWLPDGSGLLTTNLTATHTDLMLVRPNGRSTVLSSGDARGGIWAVPSRDGKRLALFMQTRQSDAFVLDLLGEADK
jgi:Tol biopolymer transport system component